MNICEKESVPVAQIRNMKEVFDLPAAQDLILEQAMEDGSISKRVKTAIFKLKP